MKVFGSVSIGEIVSAVQFAGSISSVVKDLARAQIIKKHEGQVLKEDVRAYPSVRCVPAQKDVLSLLESTRFGCVVYREKQHTVTVVFPKGSVTVTHAQDTKRIRRVKGSKVTYASKKLTTGRISLNVFGCEPWVDDMVSRISQVVEPHKVKRVKESSRRKLHVLSQRGNRLTLKPIAAFEDILERKNYGPEANRQFDRVVEQLSSSTPDGRLVMIHGPTGTGKTYMVRGLIEACKNQRFVLIPSQMVPSMTAPGLAELLLQQREATCLVIEDADMLLVRRGTDNMLSVASLLNLADGMFGVIADVRIICTTNAAKLDLDPAMIRPGRLLEDIEVPMLSADHANRVLSRLTSSEQAVYDKPATLAQVYKQAQMGDQA